MSTAAACATFCADSINFVTSPTQASRPATPVPRRAWLAVGALSAIILILWAFPSFWYKQGGNGAAKLWFHERDRIEGWSFKAIPVEERAEKLLVADSLFSGVFTNQADARVVQVFSAKRYSDKPDEIGLFMHTPDRCWTDAGWDLKAVSPSVLQVKVNGVDMMFERRLFVGGGKRELVYFGGMVGGQPVPYRLDHNLPVGLKRALRVAARKAESGVRAADTTFWRRIWQGFVERNPLLGPKQFVRLSTACPQEDLSQGDRVLQDFLGRWLEPSDYQAELQAWQSKPEAERKPKAPPKEKKPRAHS